ncbi:MAG: hypothetical protein EXR77_04080 [Myxococcales bacterium]|nr:hypothetical protein [Myxococcales bacterium]
MPTSTRYAAAVVAYTATVVALCGCVTAVGSGAGAGAPLRKLSATEAQTTARNHIRTALQHAEANVQFAEGIDLAHAWLGRPTQPPRVCDPLDVNCQDGVPQGDLNLKLGNDINKLDKWLAEQVFADAQLEQGEADEVIYRLQPATFCNTANLNDSCVKFLLDVPIRLRATSTAVGEVEVAVLFSEERVELARVTLRDQDLKAVVILDVKAATTAACKNHPLSCLGGAVQKGVSSLWKSSKSGDFDLVKSAGRLQLSYTKTSATQARLQAAVLSKVDVAYKYQQKTYAATLQPSTVTVVVDAVAKSADVNVGIGSLLVEAPYQTVALEFADCETVDQWGVCAKLQQPQHSGSLQLVVGGLVVVTKLVVGQKVLTVNQLGLGTTTTALRHNGKVVAAVDLNAASGRIVSGSAHFTGQDSFAVELAGELVAAAQVAALALAKDFGLPAWLRDETVTGRVSGVPVPKVALSEGELRVDAGQIVLQTDVSAKLHRSAAVGQCLTIQEQKSGTDGLLGNVVVAACQGK